MLERIDELKAELHRAIVGQDVVLERLIIALLVNGHVLLEGVPGLAKTRTLKALCQCLSASMQRVQFTPDLLPSDIVGTELYNLQQGTFTTRRGPVFTNFLLADEINRAPSKVQSALLQAMEERQVTLGETTYSLPVPFFVLATQNPIEQEGTYPLPEAQLDRFLMKVIMRYPKYEEELTLVSSMSEQPFPQCNPVMTLVDLARIQDQLKTVFIDPRVDRYIVSLVHNTRDSRSIGMPGTIEWGASPRASLALRACGRAHALIRKKNFVSPDDVKAIAADVLRHRIILGLDAESQGITPDVVIEQLLAKTQIP